MKKIKAIFGLLFVALMFASCEQEEGALYKNPDGATRVSLASTRYVADLVPEDGTEIKLAVQRTDANGSFDARFSFKTNSALFTMADTVAHFANGETTTYLTVAHPGANQLGIGTTYTLTVSLAADIADILSPGGNLTQTLTLKRLVTWVDAGTGMWTEGIIAPVYGTPVMTYPVSVQKAEGVDGLYRMVNAYGFGVYPYTEEGEVVTDPCYITIDAVDPDRATIAEVGLGIAWNEGEIYVTSLSGKYGTRNGKTITFPAQTLAVGMRNFNNGALYAYAVECVLVAP
jgi:hypothetical protein